MKDIEDKYKDIINSQTFNFGIKNFKRVLKKSGLPSHYINKASKMYKDKVYYRLDIVKNDIINKLQKGDDDAKN